MAEEMREPIRISIDHDGACTQFFNGVNIQGIRVFPACKYADCGPRTLSPSELNEAVQMWLNRADLMEKIRVLESQAHVMYCCNGDVAKDIGTLTLRVDKMEKDAEILKDKTSRELSQAFAEVNRVLAERKQNADVARDVSNAQAHEILKMRDQIKGLEHRLGLAQDRIAEIHPSGCVPPVKSKPKSRLKTDRVKKVK